MVLRHKGRVWLLIMVAVLGAQFILSWPAAAGSTVILGQSGLEKVFMNMLPTGSRTKSYLPGIERRLSHFKARPAVVKVLSGPLAYRLLSKNGNDTSLRQEMEVAIMAADGEEVRVSMSADVELWGDVVCAARNLSRNTILRAADLDTMRRNITMLGPDVITDPAQAAGLQLKTAMRPGSVFFKRLLKRPMIVKRGDMVTIVVHSGPLMVRAAGRIDMAGALGDMVMVKNLMSRKKIYARIVNAHEVEAVY